MNTSNKTEEKLELDSASKQVIKDERRQEDEEKGESNAVQPVQPRYATTSSTLQFVNYEVKLHLYNLLSQKDKLKHVKRLGRKKKKRPSQPPPPSRRQPIQKHYYQQYEPSLSQQQNLEQTLLQQQRQYQHPQFLPFQQQQREGGRRERETGQEQHKYHLQDQYQDSQLQLFQQQHVELPIFQQQQHLFQGRGRNRRGQRIEQEHQEQYQFYHLQDQYQSPPPLFPQQHLELPMFQQQHLFQRGGRNGRGQRIGQEHLEQVQFYHSQDGFQDSPPPLFQQQHFGRPIYQQPQHLFQESRERIRRQEHQEHQQFYYLQNEYQDSQPPQFQQQQQHLPQRGGRGKSGRYFPREQQNQQRYQRI